LKGFELRILLIRDGRYGVASRRAHVAHRQFLNRIFGYADVFIYGPKETAINPKHISPLTYRSSITARDLVQTFRPDLFLFWTHTLSKDVIPQGLHLIDSIPKIIVEIDLFFVKDWNWYRRVGMDLMLIRGVYNITPIPSVRLPFSFNEKVLGVNQKIRFQKRHTNIGFCGSGVTSNNKNSYYSVRRKAVKELSKKSFFANMGYQGPKRYQKILSVFKGMLSCSAPPRYSPVAKTFEIMGSGAICITSYMRDADILFGDNSVNRTHFVYRDDCSDLVGICEYVLKSWNRAEMATVSKNAIEVINKYHTHDLRMKEMMSIFQAILSGESLPKRWGR